MLDLWLVDVNYLQRVNHILTLCSLTSMAGIPQMGTLVKRLPTTGRCLERSIYRSVYGGSAVLKDSVLNTLIK
jgi:hypothetical protein